MLHPQGIDRNITPTFIFLDNAYLAIWTSERLLLDLR